MLELDFIVQFFKMQFELDFWIISFLIKWGPEFIDFLCTSNKRPMRVERALFSGLKWVVLFHALPPLPPPTSPGVSEAFLAFFFGGGGAPGIRFSWSSQIPHANLETAQLSGLWRDEHTRTFLKHMVHIKLFSLETASVLGWWFVLVGFCLFGNILESFKVCKNWEMGNLNDDPLMMVVKSTMENKQCRALRMGGGWCLIWAGNISAAAVLLCFPSNGWDPNAVQCMQANFHKFVPKYCLPHCSGVSSLWHDSRVSLATPSGRLEGGCSRMGNGWKSAREV